MFEIAAYPELEKISSTNKIENVSQIKIEAEHLDKSLFEFITAFTQKHSPFLSAITTEANVELPTSLKEKVSQISNELSIDKEIQAEIEKIATKLYLTTQGKITLSKTSENEFIIYTVENGTYKNILIDEDGDVEVLIIPQDRTLTSNKRFYKEDGINHSLVVSALNELR